MKRGKNDFFWASYSDLMTSLFFVMFVLFVILYNSRDNTADLRKKNEDLQKQIEYLTTKNESLGDSLSVSKKEKDKLKELEYPKEYIDSLIFKYEQKYKRFALINDVKFDMGQAIIKDGTRALEIGRSIVKLIENVNGNKELKSLSPRYLVVIEGMASKHTGTEDENYFLSYRRAYSLYQNWRKEPDIRRVLDNEGICEIIIAGSGIRGVGRVAPSYVEMNGAYCEDDTPNQRFLIQIIPKISTQ